MPGTVDENEEPGRGAAGRWGSTTLLAVLGAGALVAVGLAAPGWGVAGWVAFALLAAGVGVGLTTMVRGGGTRAAAIGLGAWVVALAATVVAWWGLVDLEMPRDPVDRLVWVGPDDGRYPAALLVAGVVVVLTAGLVQLVVANGRRLPPLTPARATAVAVAVALGVGGTMVAIATGNRWADHNSGLAIQTLDRRPELITSADHGEVFHDGSAAADGPGPGMHQLWSAPSNGRTALVPGTDLVLTVVIHESDVPGGGSSGIAVLDAATGRERWHLMVPGSLNFTGVAASPRFDRVIAVFRDVAVGLDLSTGAERWHKVLPADPPDPGDDPPSFAVVGAPLAGSVPIESDPLVPGFFDTVVVRQRVGLPVGQDTVKVMALGVDGRTRLIERSPADECRYFAAYSPDGGDAAVVRDSDSGACGATEVGDVRGSRMMGRFDVAGTGCTCPVVHVSAAGDGTPWATLVQLTEGHARVLPGVGSPGDPFVLPSGVVDATVVPPRGLALVPEVVVEADGSPAQARDIDGKVTGPVGPLRGEADRSVVTPGGWYRFEPTGDTSGRIVVVDPKTLRGGRPGPSVPCGAVVAMSAARGRLLVMCPRGDYYVYGS